VSVEFQAPPEKPGVQPPLSREVMAPIEALSRDMFPGIAVIPTINSGATDGTLPHSGGNSDVWRAPAC
jgi:hypothetical protein